MFPGCVRAEACHYAGNWGESTGGGGGVRRRVACAQVTEYDGGDTGGNVDGSDKGPVDGAGLDEGPGVRTDDGAGLAEGLSKSEERRPEVEARQAELDEGAGDRQRGRHGTRPGT